jgi:DNA repair protein RAD50
VTAKEIELEELSEELEHMTTEDAKFFDSSTSFKETYIRIESLENRKQLLVIDMEEAAGSIQELDGLFA